MIGSLGWMELTIIAIIALLVVGPRGLPKLGRSLGQAFRAFKREANELKAAIELEVDEEERRETAKKKRKKPKTEPAEAKPESE